MYDQKQKKLYGFTLIELLVIIVIISTIGTLSAVFFSRFLGQNAVINTQDELLGALRKAQIYSMMGKQNGGWGVAYISNKIILFKGDTYLTRNAAYDESISINSNISLSGFSEIDFAKKTGYPSTSGTYTIAGATSSKQITINTFGVVSRQ
jgi:Tfp pilus assembly protein FimT